ncbi:hypothetical protein [Williamsia sp. Leaf354]|nr:hypothetical protein [Williamsia sp. Leaf354]
MSAEKPPIVLLHGVGISGAVRDIAAHTDRMTHGEAVSAMRDLVD